MVKRALFACLLATIAGCANVPPEPPDVPDIAVPEPEPLPPPPQVEQEPVPAEVEAPPRAEVIEPTPRVKAAIVLSDRSPAFEKVATELAPLLDQTLLYNLSDKSLTPKDAFAAVAESGAAVVIAIGRPATQAAAAWSTIPVVYCQVFNYVRPDDLSVPVKGVASLPPLSAQVEAWKQLDPELESIGAILGVGHEDLLREAKLASATNGIALHYRVARSDRETLYMFHRMAPHIDGFWLFPDNRVLSVPVLEQIVSIAARHGVRIAAFNDALLEMGVALSTASVDADIAATVVTVAEKIVAGDSDAIPDLTRLGKVRIATNPAMGGSSDTLAAGETEAGGMKGRL
ncbi:MAG: ABC transporter substrate binding protein [Woeseiaceae bacterium]